ncbi:BRO1 domain-containing protein BROX [Selaginella moellendorffii]|nr:BRO1 domain-containing protein BROX [Selaginella moellendorffii]|eukprot:XP_002980459.2 BRO1 domain-containing protein BROX [Selaginella moellendorffii]
MLLHFRDPSKLKTKRVVFEATYYARDSGTLEQLKDLSTKRKAIEESINGSSNLTAAIAREMAGGVTSPILQDLQKLEKYLPLLENLVANVIQQQNLQILQWTSDLKLRWTSALCGPSGHGLGGPKYCRIDDLRFELAMMLSLYAALLRERAMELLATDLVESAMLFRRASGVYHHLSQDLLPGLQTLLSLDKSPELTSSMATAMSLVCLAEAQAVTVRKAEQNMTSGSLVAKLHYGVVMFLEEAINLLQASSTDWIDISDKLKRFMTASSVLHEARCRRLIAEEFKKIERLGMAAGILRLVSRKAHLAKPPGDGTSKLVFKAEITALNEMLRKCEHENDFIWREKLPQPDEIPLMEGKKIVSAIPYKASGLWRELIFVV